MNKYQLGEFEEIVLLTIAILYKVRTALPSKGKLNYDYALVYSFIGKSWAI